jgi:hypothetical protein
MMFCNACSRRLENGDVTDIPERTVRRVCRQLGSRDRSVVDCATRKLAQLHDPRSADALDAFLARIDYPSLNGLRALLNTGDRRAADHLRTFVNKYDSPEALAMLVRAGDDSAVDRLGAYLLKRPSYLALRSLAEVGGESSVSYVYQTLRDHPSWWTTSTSSYDAAESLGATPDITTHTSFDIDSALLQLYLLGNRLGSGHLLVVRTAARLTEDPQCAYRDAAADALRRYLVKWRLRRHTACREVVTATARRLQQSDSAGQARAAKLLGVLDPA